MALRRAERFEGRLLALYIKAPYKDRETGIQTSPESEIAQLLVKGYKGSGEYEVEIYEILEFKLKNGHTSAQYKQYIDKEIEIDLARSAYVMNGSPADSYSTINGLYPVPSPAFDSKESKTSASASYLKAAS